MAVTLKDIAQLSGVSAVTVSYVLNNKNRVGESTRKKVLEAAAQLNYVPNRAAKTLAGVSSKQICLIVSGPGYEYLGNPYLYKLVTSIKCELDKVNFELTLRMATTHNEVAFIRSELNSKLYDGALLWGSRMNDEDFSQLFKQAIPLVSIARDCEESSVNSVTVEHYECAYKMTKHIIDQGRRKILFLGRLDSTKSARDRFLGYKQALIDNNIAFDENCSIEADYYQENAFNIIKKIEPFNFDAIFAASDMMAIGAMKALIARNISIPDTVSVAGFDNIPNSDFLPVNLTTVDTPIDELGRQATKMLLQLVNGKHIERTIKLPASLLIRDSV